MGREFTARPPRDRPARAAASSHARLLAFTTILSILTGLAWPSGALARPAITVIDRTPVFVTNPSGRFTVCNNEKKSIAVRFEVQVTYRNRGSTQNRVGFQSPAHGGIIKAAVVDPNVGSIEPPFQVTTAASPTAWFRFTARNPGRTIIRFNEVGRYNIAREVPVVVDKCTYRISGFGQWQIPDGFQPNLFSEFNEIAVIPTGPGQFTGSGTVFNTAVGGSRGGCVPTFTVSNGTVGIEGTDDGRGVTTFEFTYTSVTAKTDVMCGISGGRSDTAQIRRASVRARSFEDGRYGILPHILDAHVAIPGDTYIIVKLVRESPP